MDLRVAVYFPDGSPVSSVDVAVDGIEEVRGPIVRELVGAVMSTTMVAAAVGVDLVDDEPEADGDAFRLIVFARTGELLALNQESRWVDLAVNVSDGTWVAPANQAMRPGSMVRYRPPTSIAAGLWEVVKEPA